MSSMPGKRKRGPNKKADAKRAANKKKHENSDIDSDLSGDSDVDTSNQQPDEVLIAGHGDELDVPTKLPEELINSMLKPAGPLLLCGQINWDLVGKRDNKKMTRVQPNLWVPHRFGEVRVRLAAGGCNAVHSVLVREDGQAMTFGRNIHGQLGHNDIVTRDSATEVTELNGHNIIGAACGRNHTLFLTDTGTVYTCGDNRSGQCGVGNLAPQILKPTRINYRGPPIIKVGCGADFSVILDCKGGLHTFGLPEYGQLGHNTDGKYFQTSTKLGFHFETSPKRVVLYIEKSKDGHVTPVDVTEIVDFACGTNHTVAIDSKKRAFSWGFGGFGRLGHAEPKDEYVPRLIKYFDTQSRGIRSVICGGTFSLAISDIGKGCLFLFGQTKRTGEANMYPKPVQDLAGWDIKQIGVGNTSIMIAADESVIAWGASPTFGELALGDFQKSTTTPKEVSKMEGIKVLQLSMGYSHTMFIVDDSTPKLKERLEEVPVFEP